MQEITRPRFTTDQLKTANDRVGLITPKLREGRKIVPTYPIDNLPPETPSDRDDGIYVEAQERDGGYRLYITIADVAAHVPLSHTLADAPRKRAFTIYRPWMIDTMFPKALEDRLSLEDGKERLGMTVVVDLDKNYQPTHTELRKVITHAKSLDYKQAEERMKTDPQIKLMARIAHGIQYNFFRDNDAAWQEQEEANTNRDELSGKENAATRMVATYMLLANYSVASLFSTSGLPFLYRNFDGKHVNDGGQPRAYYSTECTKHTEMEKFGLKGPYCHVTSPIRRAPDFYNGHMMHYAIRQLQAAENGLREIFPDLDESKLRYQLWQQAGELLKAKENLPQLLSDIAHTHGAHPDGSHQEAIAALSEKLLNVPPPIVKDTLEQYAAHINQLNWHEQEVANSPEIKAGMKDVQRFDEHMRALEGITSSEYLTGLNQEQFSSLLKKSAVTGNLPLPLLRESLTRISESRFDRVLDSLRIMLLAQYPESPRWILLKKAIANAIKHEPTTIENILEVARNRTNNPTARDENYFPHGEPVLSEATLQLEHTDSERGGKQFVNTAIYTIPDETGQLIGPPFFSIGHDSRSARTHAIYSFIENMGFGQLQPVAQTAIPDPLFAELNHTDKPKRRILEEMLEKIGAQIVMRDRYEPRRKHVIEIEVNGGKVLEPIRTGASGDTLEEAQEKAIRRLLRKDEFKNAVTFMNAWETHRVLFPREELQSYADENELTLEFTMRETRRRSITSHHTELTITNPATGKTLFSSQASGPNRDRAMNDICSSALKEFGILETDARHGMDNKWRAWVTEEQNSGKGGTGFTTLH